MRIAKRKVLDPGRAPDTNYGAESPPRELSTNIETPPAASRCDLEATPLEPRSLLMADAEHQGIGRLEWRHDRHMLGMWGRQYSLAWKRHPAQVFQARAHLLAGRTIRELPPREVKMDMRRGLDAGFSWALRVDHEFHAARALVGRLRWPAERSHISKCVGLEGALPRPDRALPQRIR